MDQSTNSLNWFEIPAKNIGRASKFYEAIFAIKMRGEQEMMGMKMNAFPYEPASGKASGAVVQSEFHIPSENGALIYLNANPKIQTVIDRIEKAGGKLLMPRTQISPEIGYMAIFRDTEGNKVALHGQN